MRDLASSSRLIWALVAVLGQLACTIDADYAGTRYRCSDTEACPVGQECTAGFCQASLADAGVDANDQLPQVACGTLDVLADDFDDPVVSDQIWHTWDWNGFIASIENGVLVLSPPANLAENGSDGGYGTRLSYLVAGGQVSAEVTDIDPDSETAVTFEIDNDARDASAAIRHYQGTLYIEQDILDQRSELATLPYSATQHRWWRIRELDGTLFWETSPDGSAWTAHVTASSEPFLGPARVYVWGELYVSEPAPKPIRVTVINGELVSNEPWCPITSLTDDFDDGEIAWDWELWEDSDCTIAEADGALVVTHAGSSDCGYGSRLAYDLSDASVTVEVPDSSDPVGTVLGVWLPDDHRAEIERSDGQLIGIKEIKGQVTTAVSVPYDPIAHRWWRIRSQGGTVYWEAAADGKSWDILASHGSPAIPLDAAYIELWSYSDTGGVIRFDNLNITP